jgi:hypothetical protein
VGYSIFPGCLWSLLSDVPSGPKVRPIPAWGSAPGEEKKRNIDTIQEGQRPKQYQLGAVVTRISRAEGPTYCLHRLTPRPKRPCLSEIDSHLRTQMVSWQNRATWNRNGKTIACSSPFSGQHGTLEKVRVQRDDSTMVPRGGLEPPQPCGPPHIGDLEYE